MAGDCGVSRRRCRCLCACASGREHQTRGLRSSNARACPQREGRWLPPSREVCPGIYTTRWVHLTALWVTVCALRARKGERVRSDRPRPHGGRTWRGELQPSHAAPALPGRLCARTRASQPHASFCRASASHAKLLLTLGPLPLGLIWTLFCQPLRPLGNHGVCPESLSRASESRALGPQLRLRGVQGPRRDTGEAVAARSVWKPLLLKTGGEACPGHGPNPRTS